MADTTCTHRRTGQDCEDCAVRALSVCAALEVDELDALQRIARSTPYEPRATLFNQEDPSSLVFSITSGVVRLYRMLPDGRRQILGFALPGDFLGVPVNLGYGFSAEAVDAVTVCKFARRDYQGLVDQKPHLLKKLHAFSANELSLAQDQITLLGRCTAEERVVSFLLRMRERWAALHGGKRSVTVHLPMSRQDIADYLGLTIETVSRTITRLARGKVITVVPDGIRLNDVQHVERLAA